MVQRHNPFGCWFSFSVHLWMERITTTTIIIWCKWWMMGWMNEKGEIWALPQLKESTYIFTGNGSKDREILHQMSLSLAASICRRGSFRDRLEACVVPSQSRQSGGCVFVYFPGSRGRNGIIYSRRRTTTPNHFATTTNKFKFFEFNFSFIVFPSPFQSPIRLRVTWLTRCPSVSHSVNVPVCLSAFERWIW